MIDTNYLEQNIGTAFKIEIRDFAKTFFEKREVLDAYISNGISKIHHPVIVKQVNSNSRLELISLLKSKEWIDIKKNDSIDLVAYKGHSLIKFTANIFSIKTSSEGLELELNLPQYGQRYEQRRHMRIDIPMRVRLIDNEYNLIFQSKFVHENNFSIGGMGVNIGQTKLEPGQYMKFELKAYFDAEEQLEETELSLKGVFHITRIIEERIRTRIACGKFSDLDQSDDYIANYVMRFQQFLIRTGRSGVSVKSN